MMPRHTKIWSVAIPILIALSVAQVRGADTSPHKPGFVCVNNVKLHYLDWGGTGDTMLFLAGVGNTPHVYDGFAPKFTNQFRVLGLTRRGHGESQIPPGGYDTATRVEDIRQFLDGLQIQRAVLVGHSASGGELTMLAGLHPDRTIKVVYLDAVFDRDGQSELWNRLNGGRVKPRDTEIPNALSDDDKRARVLELMSTHEAQTDFKKIKSPVLAFHVVGFSSNGLNILKTREPDPKARETLQTTILQIKAREIARFRQELPTAHIVYFTNADHACFIDREPDVLREMRPFLAK